MRLQANYTSEHQMQVLLRWLNIHQHELKAVSNNIRCINDEGELEAPEEFVPELERLLEELNA